MLACTHAARGHLESRSLLARAPPRPDDHDHPGGYWALCRRRVPVDTAGQTFVLKVGGESELLTDWQRTLRIQQDEGTCLRLLSAHDGEPVSVLPARFNHDRRSAAVLSGTVSLLLARIAGYPGATGPDSDDSTLSLGEFYQRMRTGALNLRAAEGQWAFGLALVKESLSFSP